MKGSEFSLSTTNSYNNHVLLTIFLVDVAELSKFCMEQEIESTHNMKFAMPCEKSKPTYIADF